MEVPAWTRVFHFASCVDSCATSTSVIRLVAASRLALLVESNSEAKPRRLCSAPLEARNVATFCSAVVIALKVKEPEPRLVTLDVMRAPIPVPELLKSRPARVMEEDELPSSVADTVKLADPNKATPLNFSVVKEVNWLCSAVNSES